MGGLFPCFSQFLCRSLALGALVDNAAVGSAAVDNVAFGKCRFSHRRKGGGRARLFPLSFAPLLFSDVAIWLSR